MVGTVPLVCNSVLVLTVQPMPVGLVAPTDAIAMVLISTMHGIALPTVFAEKHPLSGTLHSLVWSSTYDQTMSGDDVCPLACSIPSWEGFLPIDGVVEHSKTLAVTIILLLTITN